MPGQGINGRWKLKVPAFRLYRHPLWAPAAPATRTAVPRHHASGPGAETPAPHLDRRGGPPTQNTVSRWHHPSGDDPAGIPPTPSGARPAAPASSHSVPWRIRTSCHVAVADRARRGRPSDGHHRWGRRALLYFTTGPHELGAVTHTRLRHRHHHVPTVRRPLDYPRRH